MGSSRAVRQQRKESELGERAIEPSKMKLGEKNKCEKNRTCKSTCVCAQSRLTLCDPVDCGLPASPSLGFPRWEHWSEFPFPSPGDLSNPGIESASPMSPALTGRFFTTSATSEAHMIQKVYAWVFLQRIQKPMSTQKSAFESLQLYSLSPKAGKSQGINRGMDKWTDIHQYRRTLSGNENE